MRLFHLHNTVKIQTFYPVFPLAESLAKTFCWLFLWNFKEKASTIFYDRPSKKPLPKRPEGAFLRVWRLPLALRGSALAAQRRFFPAAGGPPGSLTAYATVLDLSGGGLPVQSVWGIGG